MADHSLETPEVTELNEMNLKSILEEYQNGYNRQRESLDAIKATARSFLQIATLIMAIQGFLFGRINSSTEPSSWLWIILIMVPSYAIMVLKSVEILSLKAVTEPFSLSWNDIAGALLNKPTVDVLMVKCSAFDSAIRKNEGVINDLVGKTKTAKISLYFLLGTLTLSWLASF